MALLMLRLARANIKRPYCLSESTYDEMGAGIARAGGGANGGITFNVSVWTLIHLATG